MRFSDDWTQAGPAAPGWFGVIAQAPWDDTDGYASAAYFDGGQWQKPGPVVVWRSVKSFVDAPTAETWAAKHYIP